MTRPDPGPWDADLSAAASAVEGLGVRLAIWQARTEPDAHARRCASDAITAIDTATAALHQIRARLASETRRSDDEAAARADDLIAAAREEPPGTGPPGMDDGPRQVIPAEGRPSAEPPPSAIDMARVTRGSDSGRAP